MHWWVIIAVAVWWIANMIASISSKSVMIGGDHTSKGVYSLTPAFKDTRWIELTVLQHLLGGVVSMVWLKVVMNKSLHPQSADRRIIAISALGNVVGNIATNAAYAAVSSSMTQIIKACEPIFTFVLVLLLYKKEVSNYPILSAIFMMSSGACIFVIWDISFNVWGICAAIVSNMAFPLRNIYLKKLSDSWDSPLQKYSVISIYSVILLLPVMLLKYLVTQALPVLRPKESMISAVFHFTYNVASITVLQTVTPLNHAILNLSKRVFVILANLVYFSNPLSWTLCFGLLVFFIGLVYYGIAQNTSRISKTTSVLLTIFTACILFIPIIITPTNVHSSLKCQNRMSTAWVFEQPIPQEIVQNIEALHVQNRDIPFHMYCGTSQCINAIKELNSGINVHFLAINDIVKGTPLEGWLLRHTFNKILAGVDFEDHLRMAVQLGLLWRYGGIYFNPTLKLSKDSFPSCNKIWTTLEHNGIVDFANFPPEHLFIYKLEEEFVENYPLQASHVWPVKYDHQYILKEQSQLYCEDRNNRCPSIITTPFSYINYSKQRNHFGILSHDTRVKRINVANLGDEVQGFPGAQFLPFIDRFLERDALSTSFSTDGQITAFFNAWWGDSRTNWPPPKNINPVLLSLHLDPSVKGLVKKNISYMKDRAPIGCRDTDTLDFFKGLGVDAFFSGCMTLMLKNPNIGKPRTDTVYLVDVKDDIKALLPHEIQETGIVVKHYWDSEKKYNNLDRFAKSYQLIEQYSQAKVVITQRIHCALPCVAMGVPVIFINSPAMPGGGGSKTSASSRVVGLTPLFQTLDMYSMSKENAKVWFQNYNWQNPPKNPDEGRLKRMRATFWNVIRKNQAFHDSARKFGLLPLSRPAIASSSQLVFHLLFSTSRYNIFALTDKDRTSVGGFFNKIHWRGIESIFYHHPFAKVIVHSNTVTQNIFDVFTETGYDIEVQNLNLKNLAEDTPAEGFINSKLQEVDYENNHEFDPVIGMLILYKFGGVYLDSDEIIVRSFENLEVNVIAWEDPSNSTISETVLKFEKRHPFLEACLKELFKRSGKTSELLTRVWKSWTIESNKDIVQVLNSNTFFKFQSQDAQQKCFLETAGDDYMRIGKIIEKESYSVHLNSKVTMMENIPSKLTENTICKFLLSSFCVLCSNVY